MKYLSMKKAFWHLRVLLKKHIPQRSRQFTYVAIGDSTVEGVGATRPERSYTNIIYSSLLQTHKKVRYYNFGKKGAPVRAVVEEQLEKAIVAHPDLVTISVGANDIRLHTKFRSFEENLTYLINKLQAETSAQIVINNIPDFSVTRAVPKRLKAIVGVLIGRFNAIIYKIARKTGILFIDLHSQSKVYTKLYPETVSQDDFHPSDFGYALWANTIITLIQPWIFAHHK